MPTPPATRPMPTTPVPAPSNQPGAHGWADTPSLRHLLNLTYVPRWTVVAMNRPQSVGEHVFRVAAITDHLLRRLTDHAGELTLPGVPTVDWPLCTLENVWECYQWALLHDYQEHATGDIPSGIGGPQADAARQHLAILMGGHPLDGSPESDGQWPASREAIDVVKVADLIEALSWLTLHADRGHYRYKSAFANISERLGVACRGMVTTLYLHPGPTFTQVVMPTLRECFNDDAALNLAEVIILTAFQTKDRTVRLGQ